MIDLILKSGRQTVGGSLVLYLNKNYRNKLCLIKCFYNLERYPNIKKNKRELYGGKKVEENKQQRESCDPQQDPNNKGEKEKTKN